MTFSIFGVAASRQPAAEDVFVLQGPMVIWGSRPSQSHSDNAWRLSNTLAAPILEVALLDAINAGDREAQWFSIVDGPEAIGASHLLDNQDYADDYDTGLPPRPEARFELLAALIESALECCPATKVGIAFTDCFEVEAVRLVERSTIVSTMRQDFVHHSPSNTIYVVD